MTKSAMTEINDLSPETFVERFGFLFEHSPWIVEAAEKSRPFADLDAMHSALIQVMLAAGRAAQTALVKAHPRLADKVALAKGLTKESTAEQASVGLDCLTDAEFEAFHMLNTAYDQRFGLPFVICVRLTDKAGILEAMQKRLNHGHDQELDTALDEVSKIARLRLKDAVARSVAP